MWFEFFLIGTGWFWALLISEAVWLFGWSKVENGPSVGISLIVVALALWLFGDFNVFAWVWSNLALTMKYAGGWIAVGVVWSVLKFRWKCTDVRDRYLELLETFKKNNNISTDQIPTELGNEWLNTLKRHFHTTSWNLTSIRDIIPKPSENKAHIAYWITYWPLSVFWFVFNDMLERAWNWLYKRIAYMFENIAKAVFQGVPDTIAPASQAAQDDVDKHRP